MRLKFPIAMRISGITFMIQSYLISRLCDNNSEGIALFKLREVN